MTRRIAAACLLSLLAAAPTCAQRGWGRGGGRYAENARTAREVPQNSYETPTWTHPPGFETDVLTFVRIRYDSRSGRSRWDTDLSDSDLNLSYRLQQMTAMRVDPDGRILRLTDEDLSQFPFIYIVEPGSLYLSDEEAATLRSYLLNGGFLWLVGQKDPSSSRMLIATLRRRTLPDHRRARGWPRRCWSNRSRRCFTSSSSASSSRRT
jgi:hypothetical protein